MKKTVGATTRLSALSSIIVTIVTTSGANPVSSDGPPAIRVAITPSCRNNVHPPEWLLVVAFHHQQHCSSLSFRALSSWHDCVGIVWPVLRLVPSETSFQPSHLRNLFPADYG